MLRSRAARCGESEWRACAASCVGGPVPLRLLAAATSSSFAYGLNAHFANLRLMNCYLVWISDYRSCITTRQCKVSRRTALTYRYTSSSTTRECRVGLATYRIWSRVLRLARRTTHVGPNSLQDSRRCVSVRTLPHQSEKPLALGGHPVPLADLSTARLSHCQRVGSVSTQQHMHICICICI